MFHHSVRNKSDSRTKSKHPEQLLGTLKTYRIVTKLLLLLVGTFTSIMVNYKAIKTNQAYIGQDSCTKIKYKGMAAKVPKVPGAKGAKPEPKPKAKNPAVVFKATSFAGVNNCLFL